MPALKRISAGGGVLFEEREDRTEVALIFRRGVWDLPKGKQEEGESIAECARREVSEELGCPLPELLDEIMTTYHEYEEENIRIGKTTHWFAMRVDASGGFHPQTKEGIEEVRWVPLPEAKRKVGYANLKKVLEAFERDRLA